MKPILESRAERLKSENERYFPNHSLEPEIGLAEYNLAASRLSTEEQALNWATNTTVVVATAVGYVSFRASEYKSGLEEVGISDQGFKTVFLFAIVVFGFLSIIHISNLLKSRTFAERKLIVLRRMLGVRYGEQSLILPNWRLEGADNPFSIHIFPGYFSYKAFPIHVLLLLISVSIIILSPDAARYITKTDSFIFIRAERSGVLFSIIWIVLGFGIYRRVLSEANDSLLLNFARFVARVLRINLVENFEIALYNIKLEIAEITRLRIDLSTPVKIATYIEDREFRKHYGINWRGTGRALWALVFYA